MNKQHITKDIGEAAALITEGIEMSAMQWKDNIAYFVFNDPEAEKIGKSYLYGKNSFRMFNDNLRMLKIQISSNADLKNRFRKQFRDNKRK